MVESGPAAAPTRYDRRKDEIINAAARLINRVGLRDTTLAVVAIEVGLNLKSLRHYFSRREDLVATAFRRSIALHRKLAEASLAGSDPEARVRRFITSYFTLAARVAEGLEPPFVHFGDLRAIGAPHFDIVAAEYSAMFRSIRALLDGGSDRIARSMRNVLTHMLLSQLLWSVVWLDGYLPRDYGRVADRLTDILINGVAARAVDLTAEVLPVVASQPDGERLSQASFLRAATALINAEGYRGASVDRISSELNVTKGAFYHHNDTRDALVVACFERTFAVIGAAQDAALATGFDNLGRVAAVTANLVQQQMSPDGVLLRTSALTAVGPELRGELAAAMERYTTRFAGMLNDGLIDGSVRPCDLRIAAEMVTAAINSAEELDRWVPDLDRSRASELYVGPLLVGLGISR